MAHRRSSVAAVLLAVTAALGLLITGPASAAVGEPIGPGQYFAAVVNGVPASDVLPPVVRTVCAGPARPGRTGRIAGGQTAAVVRTAKGPGYTGLFSQVSVWFAQDASAGTAPHQVRLTAYRTPVALPADAVVPCDGPGQLVFSSCPYLAPCAVGWVPITVAVRFVDIAV